MQHFSGELEFLPRQGWRSSGSDGCRHQLPVRLFAENRVGLTILALSDQMVVKG